MENESRVDIFRNLCTEVQSWSKIIYVYRIDEKSSIWNTEYHTHHFLELLYFVRGEAVVAGDVSRTALSSNDLIIYPSGYGHKEYVDFSKHQEVLVLGIQLKERFALPSVLTMSDRKRELEWIFSQLYSQFQRKEQTSVHHLKYLLFDYLRQFSNLGESIEQPLSFKIQEYMLNHFRDCISQADLCEFVHVSPSYLNKVFKTETGKTPIEFLNDIRVKKSMELMKKQHFSVERVAEEVGIKDPKYFSRVFKKISGISPREFRRNLI